MANEKNLKPQAHVLTVEEQSKGGIASGKERRRRKAVADALRAALDRKAKGGGKDRTMLDEITEKAIEKLANNPSMQDIRVLADTLGELTQNIHQDIDMEITTKFGDE